MKKQKEQNSRNLSTALLERLGNINPSNQHMALMDFVISSTTVNHLIAFDERLSQREVSCLFFASKGKTSEETENILKISSATVDSHRKNIKRKLKCSTLSQAVFEGIRWGYLQPNNKNTVD